jgi:hypothetical protein
VAVLQGAVDVAKSESPAGFTAVVVDDERSNFWRQ